jgi:endonuclease/exonuclease/phosphatase family metal-dependent hydrolase
VEPLPSTPPAYRHAVRRRTILLLGVGAAALAAWVAVASTVGSPDGCLDGCAVGARRPGPLRVLSMNVLHGFPGFDRQPERLDLVADEMVRRGVDIALLQEVPWTPWTGDGAQRIANRTGLNHVFLRANGNRFAILFEEGSAILSRFPFRDVGSVVLAPAAGPFEHRIALAATVTTPIGQLRVALTHLAGSSPEVNVGQAQSLVDWLGDQAGPIVIGGDFNADPGSPTYRLLTSIWTDAYWTVNPDDPGWTCCIDDLGAQPGTPMRHRVDYVFLGGGSAAPTAARAEIVLLDPIETSSGWLRASDHAGIYLELAAP